MFSLPSGTDSKENNELKEEPGFAMKLSMVD